MPLAIAIFAIPLWYICHEWLTLSVLTTIFIILAVLSLFASYLDISNSKKAKEKLKKLKKFKVVVLHKEEVLGYNGRTIYTFELQLQNEKIKLNKENIHKDLKINDALDVYPIYDLEKNIIDFDYDVELQSKIFMPFIIFALVTTLASILFILIDKASFMTKISDIISGVFLYVLFLSVGIYCARRAVIKKKNNLHQVRAIISALRVSTHVNTEPTMSVHTVISPIYQVIINDETYQFLGERHVKEEDKGKEVIVYYDKDTMEFFDEPKKNTDLVISVVMFIFCFLIIFLAIKDII